MNSLCSWWRHEPKPFRNVGRSQAERGSISQNYIHITFCNTLYNPAHTLTFVAVAFTHHVVWSHQFWSFLLADFGCEKHHLQYSDVCQSHKFRHPQAQCLAAKVSLLQQKSECRNTTGFSHYIICVPLPPSPVSPQPFDLTPCLCTQLWCP